MNTLFSVIDVQLKPVDIKTELPKTNKPFMVGSTSLGKMEKEAIVAVMAMGAIKAGGWTSLIDDDVMSLVESTAWTKAFAPDIINQLRIMEQDGFVEIDRSNKDNWFISPTQKLGDILSDKRTKILELEAIKC